MGTGVNGMVLSLFNDNEKYLYVGGMFLYADGQRASKVARWDGLGWSAVAGGVDDTVDAFARFGDKLVMGGSLDSAGNVSSSGILQLDLVTETWEPLGVGVTGGRYSEALCLLTGDI